jgi:predicted transposase/invertase (TIGR01784 family)
MASNPHDALFKAVFAQPEHARGALRAALPQAVSEALDWSTLERCPGSFVDPELRERHTDLLFSAATHTGGETLVYLLFEHQSTADPRMAYRLLRYMVRIWEAWESEHAGALGLPVIVPVVLYHGPGRWSAPRSFDALVSWPDSLRQAASSYVPHFTYLVDDLSQIPDQVLRKRAMSALATLAVACLKYARSEPDLLQRLGEWADYLRTAARAPNGLDALALLVRYTLLVSERASPAELQALLEREIGPEAKETVVTIGEKLIEQGVQQGIQQGIQQGRLEGIQQGIQQGVQQGIQQGVQQGIQQGVQQGIQQGVQQGRLEGERALLLRQLRRRFGEAVDEAAERRIAGASAERIEVWSVRILSAGSLAELMSDRDPQAAP